MMEKEALCSICCENFIVNEQVTNLQCGHFFHKKCILQWIKKSKNNENVNFARMSMEDEIQQAVRRVLLNL